MVPITACSRAGCLVSDTQWPADLLLSTRGDAVGAIRHPMRLGRLEHAVCIVLSDRLAELHHGGPVTPSLHACTFRRLIRELERYGFRSTRPTTGAAFILRSLLTASERALHVRRKS